MFSERKGKELYRQTGGVRTGNGYYARNADRLGVFYFSLHCKYSRVWQATQSHIHTIYRTSNDAFSQFTVVFHGLDSRARIS